MSKCDVVKQLKCGSGDGSEGKTIEMWWWRWRDKTNKNVVVEWKQKTLLRNTENNRNALVSQSPIFIHSSVIPFTTTTIATFPWFPLFYHHDTHQCIFIVFSTTNTIFLFSCLHRHCHQNNHISLLFPPPPPHCSCFSITITFLLFSPNRRHHHISIVSRATLWRHKYKFSRCCYNHVWRCLYVS